MGALRLRDLVSHLVRCVLPVAAAGLLALPLADAVAQTREPPLGARPAHIHADPAEVPNAEAMVRRIWAPGIDDGYVPQGVTMAEGQLLISGYRSTDPKIGQGPCRVYRIDPQSGNVTGQFDMPPACGHAGGLAYAGQGMLIVADTRRLYRIDMASAFRDGDALAALRGTVTLVGGVKGSFVAYRADHGGSVLVGASEKDASKARAFSLPYALFDREHDLPIDDSAATRIFPIGTDAQGAAYDREGRLWLSFSNSRQGRLERVDPDTGAVRAQYAMVIGTEGLSFDESGLLWSVSEAGSLRWSRWSTSFPVAFSLDINKLR